ncbi:uncharacterized protein LOC124460908 [Drosophila willistoni]|uniref:uncharacterized protein LOC124460908 n=1 Tax=Drosophila willistoni TaxID=7260 RepID=UPI001F07A383|nr:uncharacterized protein LOC124460908 [Drosophila willistoni]
MLNSRGPKQGRRLLLMNVMKSTMLYGAPAWANAMTVKTYRRRLETTYRLAALRVCCGFRTISDDAALVIAGMTPIDLLAHEAQRIYATKMESAPNPAELKGVKAAARQESWDAWQLRWTNSIKGRWTFRLIPDLKMWLQRKHGEIWSPGECGMHLVQER